MYIDKVKIFIKPGNGGNGALSFYTEKYVPNGGPDGGDGGTGGGIIFETDDRKTSLADFRFAQHFRAEDGGKGEPKFCHGKNGKNLVIKVPRGTIIRDSETNGILADMFKDGSSVKVLEGGYGGKGNARFKSSRRQAPHFAQAGVKTQERSVVLELKTIADVGLIGYPNVGKSTLLSVITSARPKVANYHFTTISPNLGVVKYYDNYFTIADIPGLIEGASQGAGLGHEFLRHIERTRLLVHVIDISGSEGRDPVADYKQINTELKSYSKKLAKAPQIIVLNKCDLLVDDEPIERFKKEVGKTVIKIIGAIGENTDALIKKMYQKLDKMPPLAPLEFEPFEYAQRDTTSYDIVKISDGLYEIYGGMMDELARNVILDNFDSFSYFQRKLKDEGVIKSLRRAGAKDGDTIRILAKRAVELCVNS